MKGAIAGISPILAVFLAGCTSSPIFTKAPGLVPGNICARKSADYWNVVIELNRLYKSCHGQPLCKGGLGNTQMVDVAAYSNGWLWSGSSTHQFGPGAQDTLMAQAKAAASAARPAGKVISDLQFIRDFVVPTGGGGYYIGARAAYSDCSQTLPN